MTNKTGRPLYELFEEAVATPKYVFPTMNCYAMVKQNATDITQLFLDEMKCKLPKGYSKVFLGVKDDSSVFVVSY
jgi:hypothetical protein